MGKEAKGPNGIKVLHTDANGRFLFGSVARSDVQRVDISDVDLIITTKGGEHYLLPSGGMSAMSDHPAEALFSDGAVSVSSLFDLVGAITYTSLDSNLPSSFGADNKPTQEAQPQQPPKHSPAEDNVSSLTLNTVASVEQMVQNVQKIVENLHNSNFDYVPPHQFTPPPSPPAPPPGVPAPISMTPIVTLFMGNVVGTQTDSTINPGYTTYYGGGGAEGTGAISQIGPRNALQYSPATIDATATAGNVIIYAEGPLVGNATPAVSNSKFYSKEFILNVAGYFTTLNDVKISGVPSGVSIVGATDNGGGMWTLPSSTVVKQNTFTIVYDTNATGIFDIKFTVSGTSTHHVAFQAVSTIEFMYMNVTNTSDVSNPTLVYDSNGYSREVYVLQTLDQPNIITAGNGNDIVYGSRSSDTITLGNGNNTITDGNGTDVISTGDGNSTILAGNGTDHVTVGNGNNSITLGNGKNDVINAGNGNNTAIVGNGSNVSITAGSGSNTITTAGGGGTIIAGGAGVGTNSVTINSTSNSNDIYVINLLGAGTNTLLGGDDNYNIALGNATNTVNLGNSTSLQNGTTAFDTNITTGTGTSSITVGSGEHNITVGLGATSISVGGNSNNLITTAGGGGTIISNGNGNNTLDINSASGSTALYNIGLNGTGTNTVTHSGGSTGDGDYTIAMGNTTGTNTVNLGNSTSLQNGTTAFDTNITTGTGTSSITVGSGEHNITVGLGATSISVGGNSNNLITTAGGGGTIISNGNGNNTLDINSASGSTALYNIGLNGTGTNTVTHSGGSTGDGDYTIAMGNTTGTNTVNLGNSTSLQNGTTAFDTTIVTGNGNSVIVTGNGTHGIIIGAASTLSSITTGVGNNTFTVNSAAGSTATYDITTTGIGSNIINTTNAGVVGTKGDGDYAINLAGGNSIINLGNSTSLQNGTTAFDTNITTGTGTSSITVGSGEHNITVGLGATSISVGGNSNNLITTAGGGGTIISNGNGNNTLDINSASGSTALYNIGLNGTGTNTVTHSGGSTGDGDYTIAMGNTTGTNTVNLGNSTSLQNGTTAFDTNITTGTGTSSITVGSGEHNITVGLGATSISVGGNSNNLITTAGGGGTIISNGNGNNTLDINSASGSTALYNIGLNGTGTNTVTHSGGSTGDGDYTIAMGNTTGTNTVNLGNSTSLQNGTTAFDTNITTGTGTSSITVGSGEHNINVGTGVTNIQTGVGNNKIITAGGGGSISTNQGNNTININSISGSIKSYTLTTVGTGSTNLTAGDGYYTIIAGVGANTFTVGNGNSTITATGVGLDTIVAGNGAMVITEGSANGNSISTGTGIVNLTMGNGSNSSITTVGGGGTISEGNGNNDVIIVGSGNYNITTGNGVGDHVTTGSGNNVLTIGTGGSDVVSLGNGSNTVIVGLGTGNVITGGTGSNTINFSSLLTPLTISFGTTGNSTATGTGVGDTFSGFNTLYTSNQNNTITMNTGNLTVYAGSGNDTINLGTGIETVYAGNGTNTIKGSNLITLTQDILYGGTGNNNFTSPNAGTTYDGTNGVALSTISNNVAFTFTNTTATDPFLNATSIPSSVQHAYSGGVETVKLVLNTQLNSINYSTAPSASSYVINLSSGQGIGGSAQGSVYREISTGYSSINEIIGSNYNTTLYPSLSNTVLIGGSGYTVFNDQGTTKGQTVLLVENGTATTSNYGYFYAGAASEIFVLSKSTNFDYINYQASLGGIVINLDSVAHTFSNTLITSTVSVAAYSGSNMGSNGTNSTNSWSIGDFFVPVVGTSVSASNGNNIFIYGSQNYGNLVYGGSEFTNYQGINTSGLTATYSDYFYGGSGGSFYYMMAGNHVAVAGGGTNYFYTNYGYNNFIILNSTLDTGSQGAKNALVSHSFGGTTYNSFSYGYGNVTTPVGNPYGLTYFTGYEIILANSGNDYIVGDNNGNQINAQTGTNTIILGSGTNIVDALNGVNKISSSSASGQTIGNNTLSFETTNDAYSGVLAGWNSGNVAVDVFLNYSTLSSAQSAFFQSGNDQLDVVGVANYTATQQVTTSNGYSQVQSAIITTINGSNYASGTIDSNSNSTIAISTPIDSVFSYDNVYSGASIIRGHQGNNVFLDNIGTNSESFYEGSASNIFYVTSSQIPNLHIYSATSTIDILRVEGWGASVASGSAFKIGLITDPFSTTSITGINVLDVRSGVDNVSSASTTITFTSNAAINTVHPTFNLSSADIQNLTGIAATPTLSLKLDNGDIFKPTNTVDTVIVSPTVTTYYNSTTHIAANLIATDTHNAANYYSDILIFNSANAAHLNIHFGAG